MEKAYIRYFILNVMKPVVLAPGVLRLMRDSQAALNAAWRMTLDNAGLAVAPQVVINREQITPGDVLTITPNKVWFVKMMMAVPWARLWRSTMLIVAKIT